MVYIQALTSIKPFPNNLGLSLDTLTTGLEFLEIGDCDHLPVNFGDIIKRLVNLKSLRLENCNAICNHELKLESHEVFTSIKDLPNLKILELVNINLCVCVESAVRQWNGLKALMIGPVLNNNVSSVLSY